MSYTSTSPPGIAMTQLRKMLASSSAFRDGVGVELESQARSRIDIGFSERTEPGAVIWLPQSSPMWTLYAGGSKNHLKPDGEVALKLWMQSDADDTPETRYLKGIDFAGNVQKDIACQANTADPEIDSPLNKLAVISIILQDACLRDPRHQHSLGDLFTATLSIRWGDE